MKARTLGYGLRVVVEVGLLLEQAIGRTFGRGVLVEGRCLSRL